MNATRIKGIIIQNLFHLRRSMEELVDAFFWPTLDLIIWGFMTAYFANLRGAIGGVVAFLMGGLILWNIVWRAQQDISISFLRNVWNRNLINLFSSPLSVSEFLTATIILGVIKILATLSLVTIMAFFLYSFNLFSLGFYFLPFFISLIAFAWATGIFITGLIIRYGMRIQSLAWSLIFLFHPLSAVYYPLSVVSEVLQKIAWFIPTSHIFEGMRQVLKTGSLSNEHLIWAFSLNIIYFIFAVWFFAFMYKKAQEKGSIAKIQT